MKTLGLILMLLVASGCGDGAEAAPDDHPQTVPCRAEGLGSPQTIADALELLNALPSPVTVPCVLESLDRPLQVRSTRGTISAQPAESARSPRMFVLSGHLTLSVVPDGRGRDLLEFGESDGVAESLKGELIMPIATPVSADKPFDHLRYNEHVTVCGLCHRDERLETAAGHPNAYVSRAFKPLPAEVVGLDAVRAEYASCDVVQEPERCAILAGIFGHGPVEEAAFPVTYGTIVRP